MNREESGTALSKSRCLEYAGVTIFNASTKRPMTGSWTTSSGIIRFMDGLLNGGRDNIRHVDLPAYEAFDGHVEYWEKGMLHREHKPAVISDYGNWEEWWYHGKLLMINSNSRIVFEGAEL